MNKRFFIFSAAILAFAGMSAQTSGIDAVLQQIEANNKELQANSHLISSQNWRTRQTTTSLTLHCHTPTFGTPRTVTRQSAKWSSRKASTSPRFTPPEGR